MLSERDDDLALLDVMIEALDKVAAYTAGISPEDFLQSTLIQDAVAMNFLVVGECANSLQMQTKNRAAEAPWPRLISLRNRLAHRYQSVDRLTIFGLAINDSAALRRTLDNLRQMLESD